KKGDVVVVDGRLQINNYQAQDGQRRRDIEVDAVAVENVSNTVSGAGSSGGASSRSDEGSGESQFARSGAKSGGKGQANKQEDLDAIFASEDEIPF
ncbi:MAG TPA: single-stranded DNA-binding protein, partial [Chroococcales cyanobacterium]